MAKSGLAGWQWAAVAFATLVLGGAWAGGFALFVSDARDQAILRRETHRQAMKAAANREIVRPTAPLVAGDGTSRTIKFWLEEADGSLARVPLAHGIRIEILEPRGDRSPPAATECEIRSDDCFARIRVLTGQHTDRVGFIQNWDRSAARR
jgi:hypothetical protein